MNRHLTIVVSGRVQGVGFRAFVQRQADELGITGTVRNQRNGTVYIEASGNEDQLRKLIEKCKSGPAFSSVQKMDVQESASFSYANFSIVH